jgi:dihydrofolate synthase/folylpolyglutamate synthase
MNLEIFLEHKPLYYSEIDYTRMPRVYARIQAYFPLPKIIHIVGTNGKGTTGRFLANMLSSLGHSVGHYSSPHVLEFNERIWIDGNNVAMAQLQKVHEKLFNILTQEERDTLSYFEYTTFLAMLCFEQCHYVVLEAGLGGEHDATNVFAKVLSIITPIALDHQDFLGDTITCISKTKCRSMTTKALIGYQKSLDALFTCKSVAKEKGCQLYEIDDILTLQHKEDLSQLAIKNSLPKYLQDNLLLALSALTLLDQKIAVSSISTQRPFGRLFEYRSNITIDVGHNPLAAEAIAATFLKTKVILVYNSYRDKDYRSILEILKPCILHVEILDIEDERIEETELLEKVLNDLEIPCRHFTTIDNSLKYLVFGSFKVVEAFVKGDYA